MTSPHTLSRRRALQLLGTGAAISIAGCQDQDSQPNNNTSDDNQPDDVPAEEDIPSAKETTTDRVAADPTEIPPPIDRSSPKEHDITIQTKEVTAEVEPGVTFDYMTFEGQIPGPLVRVRKGDHVNLTFEVPEDNNIAAHNIDFHAAYGPGGGAEHTTVAPGDDSAEIRFKADYTGIFIYHCAVPNMDYHISAGMFGAILVEPKDGLPEVDREFYLGQHELYTKGEPGEAGHHQANYDALETENPTYVLLNGESKALTSDGYQPMKAEVGETARVYFVNGGPNLTSSFHPIGNVWTKYYRGGDLLSQPGQNIETATVSPGSAVATEMEFPVPGPVKIVDHALSRVVHKGMLGVIDVQGEEDTDIYDSDPE